MNFDIKISCNNGIISWQVYFISQLSTQNEQNDADNSYIINVAQELKSSLQKLQKFNLAKA